MQLLFDDKVYSYKRFSKLQASINATFYSWVSKKIANIISINSLKF